MPGKIAQRQDAVNLERTPAGDAVSALAVLVFRLNGALIATGDELAGRADQTSARWQVLAAIEDSPKAVAHIARLLWLTRQSVQRIADILERDGLTEYEDNPDHLRAKLVRLTPRGRAALKEIQIAQRAWADDLGAQIGTAKLRQAVDVLTDVLKALSDRRRPAGPSPVKRG
jgi:DNA-binding MarR family transcriptional regulator